MRFSQRLKSMIAIARLYIGLSLAVIALCIVPLLAAAFAWLVVSLSVGLIVTMLCVLAPIIIACSLISGVKDHLAQRRALR